MSKKVGIIRFQRSQIWTRSNFFDILSRPAAATTATATTKATATNTAATKRTTSPVIRKFTPRQFKILSELLHVSLQLRFLPSMFKSLIPPSLFLFLFLLILNLLFLFPL